MNLGALARTPDAFRSALDALGPGLFALSAGPGEWSAEEIFRHVRAADAVMAPRVIQVLVRSGVVLPAVDERALGQLLARPRSSPEECLARFTSGRAELVSVLATLTQDEWSRWGSHEARGTLTVRDLCSSIADHDREHIDQLEEVVAKVLARWSM